VYVDNFLAGFLTAWIYAAIMTLLNWILVSQSDDVFISHIIRQNRKKQKNTTDIPGIIFVQLDGVSAPVLDWQLKAGNLPNIRKLIIDEGYKFDSWHTGLPSTTPASQAGILLGNNDNIPAFRWYEKDTSRLVVANQTEGAHLIEKRLSNGNGLLVNGGVSVGNLFSGDAKKNYMVMSKLHGSRESIKSMREYNAYFYSSFGFMRSFILSIAEMFKELYQSRKQVARDMKPRIKRHGSYVLLRAATNVLLRDLQTNIVISNMISGVNSLYVDFLDYDEVAHHAGIARAESLASLSGLDRVVGMLYRAKQYAPRPYEIVFVSDHGQSQGETFKQMHNGKTLEDFVSEYMSHETNVQSETTPIEENSIKNSLFRKNRASTQNENKLKPQIVITGSGNLGNIWLNKYSKRAYYEEINKDFPALFDNLLNTNGIGIALVHTKNGPIVLGKKGKIDLLKNKVLSGENPLTPYQELDRLSLIRLSKMDKSADITVISSFDETTGEVHAFEELVGNHGGLGGWQTEAIILHPDHLKVPKKHLENGVIFGAESVHKIFKQWLKDVGQ
jgi:predicted AlkP superfamily pyrophosphatase or phosphodiesterase